MTQTIKTLAIEDLEVGKAYSVVRTTNAHGEPVLNIRRGDWRAVLITAENLARYADTSNGTHYFQPIRDRHTVRLLAAGWTRFANSRGECGMEIVTPGPLLGLACAKPALWAKGGITPMCAQHGVLSIEL
jgi:hypothetical protein